MPECLNCGAFVTADFARVFGDNSDRVRGCQECLSLRELQHGKGAGAGDSMAYPERDNQPARPAVQPDGGTEGGDTDG